MGVKASDSITLNTTKTLTDDVAATKKHFWADGDGAHVATVDGDATTGANVLIDSCGMYIREGTEKLASFKQNEVVLGTRSDEGTVGESASVKFFDNGIRSVGLLDFYHGESNFWMSLLSDVVTIGSNANGSEYGDKIEVTDSAITLHLNGTYSANIDPLTRLFVEDSKSGGQTKTFRSILTSAISDYIASISNVKGIYSGSKVLTFSNSASCQLLSVDEMNTLFNATDCGAGNTAIAISNGDFGAMGSSTFNAFYANNAWHANIGTTKTGVARINYIVVKF